MKALQGTFVLQDNHFRWLTCVSLYPSAESMDSANSEATMGDIVFLYCLPVFLYCFFFFNIFFQEILAYHSI
jgi:hypothetical protein